VRNAQLDKEAAELRRESVELSHAAQEARNGVANSQEASCDHCLRIYPSAQGVAVLLHTHTWAARLLRLFRWLT